MTDRAPRILLVDDEQSIQTLLSYPLRKEGYEVVQASDGREALERFGEASFDLVVLDVMMPRIDGLEVCRRLRARSDVPIIMLTAKAEEVDKVMGLEMGADDYITKPFNLDLLYLRMENLIRWRDKKPQERDGKMQPELKPLVITSLDEQLIKKATAYVDENISDSTITVETMAQVLGMSRVQLYKKLLSITGSTPSEFIRQIRMRRAEQLLRESQYSVSEVAYKVGFNIPRYFTKYFKEMYGVTPSQYKNHSPNEE